MGAGAIPLQVEKSFLKRQKDPISWMFILHGLPTREMTGLTFQQTGVSSFLYRQSSCSLITGLVR